MNLILDIGNTSIKAGWFSGERLVHHKVFQGELPDGKWWEAEGELPGTLFYCSVRKDDLQILTPEHIRVVKFTPATPVPVRNQYKTPETLGPDRLANAVAAAARFPGKDIVVFDTGTCLKTDLVLSDGTYAGGAISPGLRMRYKSLHAFTGKLPLLDPVEETPFTGTNTEESMHSGVLHGMVAEMDGIMERYRKLYGDPVFVLTGGDHTLFLSKLKSRIFAAPALTLEGLNAILLYQHE